MGGSLNTKFKGDKTMNTNQITKNRNNGKNKN
jgi:hypothetical protein